MSTLLPEVRLARNGTATPISNLQNNSYAMTYVDVDSDSSTFNSSTAGMSLPSGSQVLWAGLYWGGDSNNANRFTCRLATPIAGYTNVSAARRDNLGSVYQGIADVTALVSAGANGLASCPSSSSIFTDALSASSMFRGPSYSDQVQPSGFSVSSRTSIKSSSSAALINAATRPGHRTR